MLCLLEKICLFTLVICGAWTGDPSYGYSDSHQLNTGKETAKKKHRFNKN